MEADSSDLKIGSWDLKIGSRELRTGEWVFGLGNLEVGAEN